jgi:hypothetical protein
MSIKVVSRYTEKPLQDSSGRIQQSGKTSEELEMTLFCNFVLKFTFLLLQYYST